MANYIVSAPPRKGKTNTTTDWALRRFEKYERKRKKDPAFCGHVFSNYPIYHPKYGFTRVWKKGMEYTDIFDSMIVIDEAHRFYNSRDIKNMTEAMHDFFALCGQRGNDIILITHHPARIDKVVREVVEMVYHVRKAAIPFTERPLWFRLDSYLTTEEYMDPHKRYSTQRIRFKRFVAKAYDTHYFRNMPEELPEYSTWDEELDLTPDKFPVFTSRFQDLKSYLRSKISKLRYKLHSRHSPDELNAQEHLDNDPEITIEE